MPLYMDGGSEITDLNMDGVALDSLIMDGVEVWTKGFYESPTFITEVTVDSATYTQVDLGLIRSTGTYIILVAYEYINQPTYPEHDFVLTVSKIADAIPSQNFLPKSGFNNDAERCGSGIFAINASDIDDWQLDGGSSSVMFRIEGNGFLVSDNDIARSSYTVYHVPDEAVYSNQASDYIPSGNSALFTLNTTVSIPSDNSFILSICYSGIDASHQWSTNVDSYNVISYVDRTFAEGTRAILENPASSPIDISVFNIDGTQGVELCSVVFTYN